MRDGGSSPVRICSFASELERRASSSSLFSPGWQRVRFVWLGRFSRGFAALLLRLFALRRLCWESLVGFVMALRPLLARGSCAPFPWVGVDIAVLVFGQ